MNRPAPTFLDKAKEISEACFLLSLIFNKPFLVTHWVLGLGEVFYFDILRFKCINWWTYDSEVLNQRLWWTPLIGNLMLF